MTALHQRLQRGGVSILHYGLQRSGTNLLESALKAEYKLRILNSDDRRSPSHKHTRLYENKALIPEEQFRNEHTVKNFKEFEALLKKVPDYYVVISKDPYSWYLSYKNWAEKCSWPVVQHHYAEEYNMFYGFFLAMAKESDKFIFVRYADFLIQPEEVLEGLAGKMGLVERHSWRRRRETLLPTKVPQSTTFGSDKKAYYLNEQYMAKFTVDDIKNMNRILDPNVVASLGYSLKDPAVGRGGENP